MAGKVIVITGANGGLGRALAQRFTADGEHVVMLGRSQAALDEAAAWIGGDAWPLACQIGDPDSVRAAFAAIAQRHGRVDVLINNAGNFNPFLIAEATDAQILDGINGNLLGAIYCTRSAIPLMRAGSQIINVTSESVDDRHAMLAIYQCGKAGLERFSRSMDLELVPRGIRSIIFRAGQMYGEGMSTRMDPEAAAAFHSANITRGVNMPERGASSYASAAQVMRNVIYLPQDITIDVVSCHSIFAVA